jgi:hypothetical protein
VPRHRVFFLIIIIFVHRFSFSASLVSNLFCTLSLDLLHTLPPPPQSQAASRHASCIALLPSLPFLSFTPPTPLHPPPPNKPVHPTHSSSSSFQCRPQLSPFNHQPTTNTKGAPPRPHQHKCTNNKRSRHPPPRPSSSSSSSLLLLCFVAITAGGGGGGGGGRELGAVHQHALLGSDLVVHLREGAHRVVLFWSCWRLCWS